MEPFEDLAARIEALRDPKDGTITVLEIAAATLCQQSTLLRCLHNFDDALSLMPANYGGKLIISLNEPHTALVWGGDSDRVARGSGITPAAALTVACLRARSPAA